MLERGFTRGDRLDLPECFCRIVAIATPIADPNHHVLEDHEACFVLESFAR